MADAGDLKSPGGNTVWVRPPPALPDVGIYGGKPLKLGHSAHKKECAVVFKQIETQGTITNSLIDDYLLTWIEAFLIDRKVQNLSEGTLSFYSKKLKVFARFCDTQVITNIGDLTPTLLRQFLIYLEDNGHNPGGFHSFYRSLRAFLNWWEVEVEPEMWKNPIKKVNPPRVPVEPLESARISDITKLLSVCENDTFIGIQDRAMLLCLLDTGTREQEFLDILL